MTEFRTLKTMVYGTDNVLVGSKTTKQYKSDGNWCNVPWQPAKIENMYLDTMES